MDEFPGVLARDFGFRSQGKSAPMSASVGGVGSLNLGSGPATSWSRSRSGSSTGDSLLGGGISENRSPPGYDDVFGGPPRYSKSSSHGRSAPSSSSPPSYDSILDGFKDSTSNNSSLPVYDKPVYDDDDIFDGVPGIKSSSSVKYDDVFASMASNHASSPPYDDLLENLGRAVPESKESVDKRSEPQKEQELSGFDELIPGFGGSSPPKKRETPETKQQPAAPSAKPAANVPEDPFVVLETTSTSAYPSSGLFTAPLEHISRPMNSGSTQVDASPDSRGIFDDNAFDELTKSTSLFTSEMNENPKDKSALKTEKVPPQRSSMETFENVVPKVQPTKPPVFVQNSDKNVNTHERNAMDDQFLKSYEYLETADDAWLTVTEIPLRTQPTSVPPPSRLPPPVAIKQAQFGKTDQFSSVGLNTYRKDNGSLQFTQSYPQMKNSAKKVGASSIDELEDFAMGKPQRSGEEHAEVLDSEEETETNSAAAASAAAMKAAVDRAEAKFKQARVVRERERDAKSAKSREHAQQERDEKAILEAQDLEDREKQERLDHGREQREREEKEVQKRRENERAQELQRERERARQAVERATREARERAAAEARLKAERAAVDKVNAGARQRAGRAAVQRVATEARDKAAVEARDRAEKAAAEASEKATAVARERAAVERAAAEARLRSERAAVDRATTEARGRAAAEARERAARENQHKTENDFESFFHMGVRPNSAPKQRATTSESVFDAQFQSKGGSSFAVRKEPSSTTTVDDLTSIFGAHPSSEEFQEVEGENEERRRARLDRHQRTIKRVEEALAKKNDRDMQAQREQAERHRIAETLDIEIKRWAAGKEGNLRALLSTLQYVLWPESGWQPVSLTDLITGASVKKVYRKATLCIHPDKVQQKGANIQQKYIAEKVFDLLKEAWNKLNSEELF